MLTPQFNVQMLHFIHFQESVTAEEITKGHLTDIIPNFVQKMAYQINSHKYFAETEHKFVKCQGCCQIVNNTYKQKYQHADGFYIKCIEINALISVLS